MSLLSLLVKELYFPLSNAWTELNCTVFTRPVKQRFEHALKWILELGHKCSHYCKFTIMIVALFRKNSSKDICLIFIDCFFYEFAQSVK